MEINDQDASWWTRAWPRGARSFRQGRVGLSPGFGNQYPSRSKRIGHAGYGRTALPRVDREWGSSPQSPASRVARQSSRTGRGAPKTECPERHDRPMAKPRCCGLACSGGEPALDRRDVGRLAENDLPARGFAAIARSIVRAPSPAGVPSIFQNCGVSPRRYASPMKPASIAGRPTASNCPPAPHGAPPGFRRPTACRRDDTRRAACRASATALRGSLRIVRPIADQHLDECAGERALERIGRPGERKGAGLFSRRADVEAGLDGVGDDVDAYCASRSSAPNSRTFGERSRASRKPSAASRLTSRCVREIDLASHHSSHCHRWSAASM